MMKLSVERQETIRRIGLMAIQGIHVALSLAAAAIKGGVATGLALCVYLLFTLDPATATFADLLRAIQGESFRSIILAGALFWLFCGGLLSVLLRAGPLTVSASAVVRD